jgi:uncharacterized protein (DUF58 family)
MWARLRDWWLGPPLPPPPARRATPVELLRRFQLTTLRPLAELLGGDERSRRRGAGMELSEVRAYQPGDDIRFIDWNVTARTDEPYVREATVERALDVWMVVDTSRSLAWGTASGLKRDRAEEFVAAAAVLAARRGHRVGALFFAERPLGVVPPGAGRPHLLRLLAGLRQAEEIAGPGVTELGRGLRQADALLRRPVLVLVVSDFLTTPGWQPVFGRLARRHEVIAVRLTDPREAALPDVGLITLEDPETGRQQLVDTGDVRLRERFAQVAEAQAEALRRDVTRYGAELLELSTAEELLPPLRRLLDARRLRRVPRVQPAQAAA